MGSRSSDWLVGDFNQNRASKTEMVMPAIADGLQSIDLEVCESGRYSIVIRHKDIEQVTLMLKNDSKIAAEEFMNALIENTSLVVTRLISDDVISEIKARR